MPILGNLTGANSATFDPSKDLPSLTGKVILVTGGDSGIGKQAVSYLTLASPSEIWIATKDIERATAAIAELQTKVPEVKLQALEIDLASFQSIKEATVSLLARMDRLDILMLNAGVMGTPPRLTEDGYEHQFGINYFGHALLTKLLLPKLIETASSGEDVRVITISSYSHRNAPDGGIDFDSLKTSGESLHTLKRYAQSKLANILFARELAKQYPQLTALAIHPGAAQTDLILNANGTSFVDRLIGRYLYKLFVFQPVETVAKHQVWATTAVGLQSGQYYEPLGMVGQGRPETRDDSLAKRLWDWTQHELEPYDI